MRKHNTNATARTPKTPTSRRTEHVGLLTYLRDEARVRRLFDDPTAQRFERWARAVRRLLSERVR